LHESFGAVNGTIDMTFRCEMQHRTRLVLFQQAGQQAAIGNISLHKNVARITLQAAQVFQIAGIGQFVQIDDDFIAQREPVQHKIAANKAGTAGD
jgi:hypothetical protein